MSEVPTPATRVREQEIGHHTNMEGTEEVAAGKEEVGDCARLDLQYCNSIVRARAVYSILILCILYKPRCSSSRYVEIIKTFLFVRLVAGGIRPGGRQPRCRKSKSQSGETRDRRVAGRAQRQ